MRQKRKLITYALTGVMLFSLMGSNYSFRSVNAEETDEYGMTAETAIVGTEFFDLNNSEKEEIVGSEENGEYPANGFCGSFADDVYHDSSIKGDANSGSLASGLNWKLDSGILTISGKGAIPDFEIDNDTRAVNAPWFSQASSITDIVIGEGVTSIGKWAFAELQGVKNISFSNTVSAVGEAAFYEDYGITAVSFPAGVKTIGKGAFAQCINLESITLTGVQSIEDYAFEAAKLETVTIPASLKSLSNLAFFDATIKAFEVNTGNASLKSVEGVLFSKDGKKIIKYPSSREGNAYSIPSSVETVGEYAFNPTYTLDSIDLGKVKILEEGAFYKSSLKGTLTIPDSVTQINNFAFEQSVGITAVKFGKGLKKTAYRAFENCTGITSIDFGALTELDMRTFRGCNSLISVVLPKRITKWGGSVFNSCENLESFTSEGLQEIDYADFAQCYKLTTVKLTAVKNIFRQAFANCPSLKSITLPGTIQFVDAKAFSKDVAVTCHNSELVKFGDNGYHYAERVAISGTYDYDKAYEVLDIVNKKRTAAGKSALAMDKSLLESAMKRAGESSVLFSHTRPDGTLCMDINDKMYGENIAMGSSTASGAMEQWMKSEGHKNNIMSADYNIIGVGCFVIDGKYYWTQCFGTAENYDVYEKPCSKKAGSLTLDIPRDKFSEAPTTSGIIFGELNEYTYSYTLGINKNSIKAGETATASVKVTNPGDNTSTTLKPDHVSFTSSKGTVAKVNSKGTITGIGGGTTKISAQGKYYNKSATLLVTGTPAKADTDTDSSKKVTDLSKTEKSITTQKTDKDTKDSVYRGLCAKSEKSTSSSVTIKWKKIPSAKGYIIYGNKCGKNNKFKKLATISGSKTSYTQKKLKKGTFYKYIVVAYKVSGGKKVAISTSKVVHMATTGGNVTNIKKINVTNAKNGRLSLNQGKTITLKVKKTLANSKLSNKTHRNISYESSDKSIATVNSKGIVKGVKKGTCDIYVFAQNGITTKIKVTVK